MTDSLRRLSLHPANRHSIGVIRGIEHVLKSRCSWTDTAAVSGPRETLYNRVVR